MPAGRHSGPPREGCGFDALGDVERAESVGEADACLLGSDEQVVPISPLDRPRASSTSTSCSRGVSPSATARSSSRRGSEGPCPPTDRRARSARWSMAISSGVASTSWAAAQARRRRRWRRDVPRRRDRPYRRGALRRGKRPPLAGWPVATSPCRAPRTVRRRHGTRAPPHAWRTRAPGATCRLPPHPRSTPRPNPPRPRRATAARRAISPSRPTNLRPVARPHVAILAHPTRMSRHAGFITARWSRYSRQLENGRGVCCQVSGCTAPPTRAIHRRQVVGRHAASATSAADATAHRTSTCRYPEAGGMTLKPSVLERRIVGGREPADNAVAWQRPDSSITGVSQHGSASYRASRAAGPREPLSSVTSASGGPK